MSSLKAVIFDLDGVIVSTDEYHYRGWKRLADEIGVPFDREKNHRLRGISRMDSLLAMLPENHGYSPMQLEELAARKNEYYQEMIGQITPKDMLPGAMRMLDALDAKRIRKALASASRNAVTVLKLLKVENRFDTIVTGHDFERSKPAPDIFLTAAKRLGVVPAHCLVFEDARSGVQAARAADMAVVGIGKAVDLPEADRVVASLAEISVAELREIVEGR